MAVEGGHEAVAAYLMVHNADVNAAEEVVRAGAEH